MNTYTCIIYSSINKQLYISSLNISSFNRNKWRGENRTMPILYAHYDLFSIHHFKCLFKWMYINGIEHEDDVWLKKLTTELDKVKVIIHRKYWFNKTKQMGIICFWLVSHTTISEDFLDWRKAWSNCMCTYVHWNIKKTDRWDISYDVMIGIMQRKWLRYCLT